MELTNRQLVKQCIQWVIDNCNAVLENNYAERKCRVYEFSGDVPEGQFSLNVQEIVPGVLKIEITK